MEQITCDLIPGGKMPLLHASQYDEGREYRINLTENKQAYTLDGTELLTVSVRKGDNTLFTADIANTFGGKSYVDFVSTEQMCAVAGYNFGELSITKNNTRIGTVNFMLVCEPSPEASGLTSESEINNLARQVEDCTAKALENIGAKGLPFDNTGTDLEATNTEDAIKEVNSKEVDAYSKEESDEKYASKNDLNDYYNKQASNDLFAVKNNTVLSGSFSHNRKAGTTIGLLSFAEGFENTASGNYSHAEGCQTEANDNYAHAEGYQTEAGNIAHAEGYKTIANGNFSHAENSETVASGNNSHAEGKGTIANHSSQSVFGEYNVADDNPSGTGLRGTYIEIAGNGLADNSRSNARTLDWLGNEMIAGDLKFNRSTSLTDALANKAAISEIYSEAIDITWEQGAFNNNTGAKLNSSSQIRSASMFAVTEPVFIKIENGYRYNIYKYTTLDDLTTFTGPVIYRFDNSLLLTNGYYNISLAKMTGENITPSASSAIRINTAIDKSLAYNGYVFNNSFDDVISTVYPTTNWTSGKAIVSGGVYDVVNYYLSDAIKINGNKIRVITCLAGAAQIGLFDGDGAIKKVWGISNAVALASNYYLFDLDLSDYDDSYYLRITTYLSYSSVQIIEGDIYGRMESRLQSEINKNKSRFLNKKVLIIGDSISTGTSSNRAVSGQSYGQYEKWVDILIEKGFLSKDNTRNDSIHATGFIPKLAVADGGVWLSGENNFNQRLDYYVNNNLANSYDVVIVFGGINDFLNSVPLGTGSDDYTIYFKSAVNHFFDTLANNFTQARLLYVLPLRTPNAINSGNIPFDDYVSHIKDVAKSYSIPCFDGSYSSGFNPSNNAFKTMWTYQADGVHPNHDYQDKYLSEMIKSFVESY